MLVGFSKKLTIIRLNDEPKIEDECVIKIEKDKLLC
jgi:hypothetical protein